MSKEQVKNVTRDDKSRTAVAAFAKCISQQIRVKQGREKCKPTK